MLTFYLDNSPDLLHCTTDTNPVYYPYCHYDWYRKPYSV